MKIDVEKSDNLPGESGQELLSITTASDVAQVNPVICELSKGSLKDVLNIEILSDRPAWNERLFLEEFNNNCSHFYGARVSGNLCGFLLCHCVNDEAHILKFGVLPDFRNKGIGRTLITYVIREFHAIAVNWATLEVRKSNIVARKLYESVGFSEAGIRQGYYSDNKEDAIILNLNVAHFIDSFGEHPEPISGNKEKHKLFEFI